jgi:tRNA threonylcarbamoyladenosine biosynthesis protein TsaE
MEFARTSATVEATHDLGEACAPILEAGDVVALTGDLGAGKTSFVQGVAIGLGVESPVVSPTFTLVREYEGRLHVNHLDVYRLERIQDVIDLGFDEMVDSGGVTLIEWGDVIEGLLTTDHLEVEITADHETDARAFSFRGEGPSWLRRWEALERATEPWSPK